jgi:L-lysine exporter family protein LysE/ArgO
MPDTQTARSQRGLLRTAVFLGFANPYAWLDTVVLIGSIGAAKPSSQQALFALGTMTASLLWFVLLALGGRRCGDVDGVSGLDVDHRFTGCLSGSP